MSISTASPTSRRALLRSAAWSVPAVVVATASPAFAQSNLAPESDLSALRPAGPQEPCDVIHTMVWREGRTVRGVHQIQSRPDVLNAAPVTMTITTRFTNASAATSPQHFSTAYLKQGAADGLGVEEALKLAMDKSNRQVGQMDVDVVFDRKVENLSFVLTDIDRNLDDWGWVSSQQDRVWVRAINGSAPSTLNTELAARTNVQGKGVPGTPWFNDAGNATDDSTLGNVRVRVSEPVKTFSLTFQNVAVNTSGGTNSINLGGMRFSTPSTVSC